MSKAIMPAVETRSSLPHITSSLLSQSFASIRPSQAPVIAPPNTHIDKPPPRLTLTQPNTSIQSTNHPQSERPSSLPPRPAQSSTQAPSPHVNITIPILAHLPIKRPVRSTWRGFPARIHHRDDDVRDYCAPDSHGWMAWQEQRVAESQAEIGMIDYGWDGGRIINLAEQRKQKTAEARQKMVKWIDGVEEGWEVDDAEEEVVTNTTEEPFCGEA